VDPERGPLSLVSTTEELFGRKKIPAPVYKIENTVLGIRCVDHGTPSIRKLSLTSGGRSVRILRSRTQTMEVFFFYHCIVKRLLTVTMTQREYPHVYMGWT
jgi:hypothetical protein